MRYINPVLKGFYPDPSVCKANGKYYLVNSSFQYFPGVPIHESEDLINWKLIGHCLTRPSQLNLMTAGNSGGIYATTIRFNNGRFYMVTTNVSTGGNFYVWTDDIYGEWSDPIWIDQDGIDPSFYFEGDKCYFMTNGTDDEGNGGIIQCEIDIETGKILTRKRRIYTGTGGRYLEGPHLYKFGETYFLLAAEGGTEYGHMIVVATGKTPYGPFENVANNPILTNRNLGGYQIQGVGHGDIIEDYNGNYWMIHLAFRQVDPWMMFHTTGRETYLVPVDISGDRIVAGVNGITPCEIETDRLPEGLIQQPLDTFTFANTCQDYDWVHIREPKPEMYSFDGRRLRLKPSFDTISMDLSHPACTLIRQQDMTGELKVTVSPQCIGVVAGVTVYMDNEHHYDLLVEKTPEGISASRRIVIGEVNYIPESLEIKGVDALTLKVSFEPFNYTFKVFDGETEYNLGTGRARYLSTEVACGFTGVMFGLFAECKKECSGAAEFTDFELMYT